MVTIISVIYRRRRYINALQKFWFYANYKITITLTNSRLTLTNPKLTPNTKFYPDTANKRPLDICFVKFICFSNVTDFML